MPVTEKQRLEGDLELNVIPVVNQDAMVKLMPMIQHAARTRGSHRNGLLDGTCRYGVAC
jgi:hypothetical protein